MSRHLNAQLRQPEDYLTAEARCNRSGLVSKVDCLMSKIPGDYSHLSRDFHSDGRSLRFGLDQQKTVSGALRYPLAPLSGPVPSLPGCFYRKEYRFSCRSCPAV